MNYKIEKDWITEAGLRAVIIATPMGHRCGYVGISKGSPLYGLGYDDVDVSVHGGLTYASGYNTYPVKSDLYWFGFDCAHYDDKKDFSIMDESHKEIYRTLIDLEYGGSSIKDTAFCVAECEKLAKQLV